MKRIEKTIKIGDSTAEILQDMLNSGGSNSYKRDDCIYTNTIKFGGGFEAEISVINSDDGPHVAAGLFMDDKNLMWLEDRKTILGKYVFNHHNVLECTLTVEA